MSSARSRRTCSRVSPARLRTAVLTLTVLALGVCASAAAAAPQVNIASQGEAPKSLPANVHYFKTIQSAVDASHSGDWVLIAPGTYTEAVKVSAAQSGIKIRGMNRNTVVLDGQNKVANGIEISKANNVSVDNLTTRNFDEGEGCEDGCGNGIWWNGGDGSGKIGAHGWFGSYLTAYDTGLHGSYGIFTSNMIEGSWENIYASGFNDSGIYLGACQECKAKINKATMENNALGYSGSNAGGRLVIENSVFKGNAVGIAPNSENPSDPPPPQDGECNRPNIENPNPTPTITKTDIPRCTILKHNLITENGNLSAPVNGSTEVAPWGVGVELPGDYADLVENNTITNNPNNGVLAFEYPNPFPPGPETIFFQLAGNRVSNNKFAGNGNNPSPELTGSQFTGDLSMLSDYAEAFGGPPSTSNNNCASGNSFADQTFPANIQGTWGCNHKTTPNPGGGPAAGVYLLTLIGEAKAIRELSPPVGQPAPPAQPTMPNPCGGVPHNPLCK